jgi:hypothetical protein
MRLADQAFANGLRKRGMPVSDSSASIALFQPLAP